MSTKAKAHQTDNEKDKTPQGVRNCFVYTCMLYMCTPALYIICTINLHLHVRIIYLSYSTVVLYIRDYGDLGFPSQIRNSPKNQLHNSILAPWQYWLGIAKPKSAFSTILNASSKLVQNLGLDFFTVRRRFIPRCAFLHTALCTMHTSWTCLCPPLCPIFFC